MGKNINKEHAVNANEATVEDLQNQSQGATVEDPEEMTEEQIQAWEEAEAKRIAEKEAKDLELYGNKKIALYLQEYNYSEKLEKVQEFCRRANEEVLPLLQTYGLEVDPEKVRDYVNRPEELKKDIIASELQKYNKKNDPYYKGYMKKQIEEELDSLPAFTHKNQERYERFDTDKEASIYCQEEKIFKADEEALKERYTVFATGKRAWIWEQLQKATELMNEAFDGKAPLFIQQLWNNKEGKLSLKPEIRLDIWE